MISEQERASLYEDASKALARIRSAKRMIETAIGAAKNDLLDAEAAASELEDFLHAIAGTGKQEGEP